jgi:CHAD domain-containing protein
MIEALALEGHNLRLRLGGPNAAADGERALAKADLWRKAFGGEVLITTDQPHEPEQRAGSNGAGALALPPFDGATSVEALVLPASTEPAAPRSVELPWKLQPEDTLRVAARKMLRRYFQKLLAQERDVREDDDPEGVHQMRVATRRLRATLTVLGEAIGAQQARKFRRSLRDIARTLGQVRDRDVFLEHVRRYDASLSEEQRGGVAPLIAALERDQAQAKQRLLKELDAKRYARFKRICANFLTASDKQPDEERAGPTPRIRYAAGSALWRGYEQLRAYETLLPATASISAETDMELLHEMRIAGKHFRYTLELFGDALGPKVDGALDPLLALQEHLGALQDIEVAVAYVRALPAQSDSQTALGAYVAARHADRDRLLAELPRYWEKVASATYRRRLMELIVKL